MTSIFANLKKRFRGSGTASVKALLRILRALPTMSSPKVIDAETSREFERLIRIHYPKTHEWENRYVDHEVAHIGLLFAPDFCPVAGKEVLEFGCNIGATAIVLAHNGANVVACDINPTFLQLASLNAQRYGVASQIRFEQLRAGAPLPFPDRSFDVITCNSVLEYVDAKLMAETQRELNRVLRPGGQLLIFGTSNRLWPVEPHYQRWFINYLPRRLDPWLRRPHQRGVSPWRLRYGFGRGYQDLFAGSRARGYVELKRRMGLKGRALGILSACAGIAAVTPLSLGLLSPFVTVLLRKPVK